MVKTVEWLNNLPFDAWRYLWVRGRKRHFRLNGRKYLGRKSFKVLGPFFMMGNIYGQDTFF
jgi:hypothetical protein